MVNGTGETRAIGVLCVVFGAKILHIADAEEAGDEERIREMVREVSPLIAALFRITGVLGTEPIAGAETIRSIVGEAFSEEQVTALHAEMKAKESS